MKIFEKYLLKEFIKNTLIVIFVLTVVFSIFNLLEEFNDIGTADYTFASALAYVIFKIPIVISNLFNLAILIGAVLTASILIEKKELVVLQNGIVSFEDIALKIVKYGFATSLIFLIASEIFSPIANQFGNNFKAVKTERSFEIFKGSNIWLKKDFKFLYIDKNNNQDLENVLLIDLTDKDQLIISRSPRGKINNLNLEQTNAEIYKLSKKNGLFEVQKQLDKNNLTQIGVKVNFLKIDAKNMSFYNLFNKIYANSQLGINSNEFQVELLSRVLKPLYAIILLMIALPIIFDFSRNQNIPKNIFLGVLIGLIFNLIMKFSNVLFLKSSYGILFIPLLTLILLLFISMVVFKRKLVEI